LVQLNGEEAFRGPGRNAAKENVSELTALRKRVARLEEENAILKKAEAYFSGKRR
jgi:transposase-like protein